MNPPAPAPSIKSKILAHITAAGFTEGWTSTCGDAYGLPGEREVCVRPEYSFGDGASTVVVTATYVQRWFRPCPFNYTSWHPVGSILLYSNPEQLTQLLAEACRKPKGCW